MTIEVALIVSIASVCFSAYFGLRNSKRTDVKDIEERVARDTRMETKLDGISNTVNDIKYDLSSVKKDLQQQSERLREVEFKVEKLWGDDNERH